MNELTKELSEKNERKQVEEDGKQLSQDHERMPSAYGECHHRQLCEDERRVADCHNVDELVFEEQEGTKHDHTTLVHSELSRAQVFYDLASRPYVMMT